MPNYSQACVYKICCLDPTVTSLYIGSTCNFAKRKYFHRHVCHNEKNKDHNMKVYQFIRDNGGWDNWKMIEIDKLSCSTKREKEKMEYEYIQKMKADLNINKIFEGDEICEHNKPRSNCKNCGGSRICEHDRIKSEYKECHGSGICEHDRIKSDCK